MNEYWLDPEHWLHEIDEDSEELDAVDAAILEAFDELQQERNDYLTDVMLWEYFQRMDGE